MLGHTGSVSRVNVRICVLIIQSGPTAFGPKNVATTSRPSRSLGRASARPESSRSLRSTKEHLGVLQQLVGILVVLKLTGAYASTRSTAIPYLC